jgi:nitroimidazol reductase NimA-like FMN-containing flavoprotein (pyridoxamine 5'-phosphate oxidase superfamily)
LNDDDGMTSPSTRITRLPEKGRPERGALDVLLDAAVVGHFGLTSGDGHPVVIPTAIVRDGNRLLAHGSTGSPWMRRLASGVPACLTVTLLDGLVVARSAFESSLHYRSAVLFGRCSPLPPEERAEALDLITEGLLPGRTAEIRRPTARELAATLVMSFPIERWSVKISEGWPDDPPEDVAGPAWAGVIPLRTAYGEPRPAPDLSTEIALPESVRRLPPG